MHETGFFVADDLGQVGQKCDDVVFGYGLDLVDAGHIKFDILGFPDCRGAFFRNHAKIGLRVACMCLDLVPDAKLGFRRPDGSHFGAGIAWDHETATFSIWKEMMGV